MFRHRDSVVRAILSVLTVALALSLPTENLFAVHCWDYADFQPAKNPQVWGGGVCGADPGAQLVIDEHRNWHCSFAPANTSEWGRRFISFHRQLILDYDIYRIENLIGDRLETWDVGPSAPIPGDDETTSSEYTHCPTYPPGRAAGALCTGCISLPSDLVGDSNLDDYDTLGEVGARLQASGWHGGFHIAAGTAGGTCNVVGNAQTAPRDPVFWMGHKKLDAIARDWQRLKAADIVIVIDRSGSMNDDCDVTGDCGGPNDPDDTTCKLNAAKEAAKLFADLIEDDRPGSTDEHLIALVSFSSTASTELGLTAADGIVSDDDVDNTAFETAIAGMEACGATSIGAGLDEAMDILAGGSNPYQAILVLTDGLQNVAPMIDDVKDDLGDILLAAVAIGDGAAETELRDAAHDHGGLFIASNDFDQITIQKFFVDAFGQIYDEPQDEDPILVLPAGQVATMPIVADVNSLATKMMLVLGHEAASDAPRIDCPLEMIVTTPAGNLVDFDDPAVEASGGPTWAFTRVELPYRGEQSGPWIMRGVRPQRVFAHGFATDAIANQLAGINLVREEIHRLFPRGCGPVLYYEDGSASGFSAYRQALQRELTVGGIASLTTATTAAQFNSLLSGTWDLIVFARQMALSPQVFDQALSSKLCAGQKALITDMFTPAAFANPVLTCAGVTAFVQNYTQVIGDGRLVTGVLPLVNPGYTNPTRRLAPSTSGNSLTIIQASNEVQTGSIIGNGTLCGDQTYFYSTHSRSTGRVEPAATRPRVLVGQKILANFRITESNRPVGDFDMVQGTVELIRPGAAKTIPMDDNQSAAPAEVYSLFDDGTQGDKAAQNHYWSVEIPQPATAPGPHILKASFDLTEGGETLHREAEYAVIVEAEPQSCLKLNCPDLVPTRPGRRALLPSCVVNLCLGERDYQLHVEDSAGWLRTVDANGDTIPVNPLTCSITVPGSHGHCLFDNDPPIILFVPDAAQPGDETEVTVVVTPVGAGGQSARCTSTYRVVQTSLTPVTDDPPVPARVVFDLMQNQPNPFNPRTEIQFMVPGQIGHTADASLRIYDVSGRLVRTLVNGPLTTGHQRLAWEGDDDDGRRLPSGVYFYTLEAGGQTATRKMMLIK